MDGSIWICPTLFKQVVSAFGQFNNGQIAMEFSDKGLIMRTIDGPHLAIVEVELSSEAFDIYMVEPMTIMCPYERLKEISKHLNKYEFVQIKFNEGGSTRISQNGISWKLPKDEQDYSMPNFPPEGKHPLEIRRETFVNKCKAVKNSLGCHIYASLCIGLTIHSDENGEDDIIKFICEDGEDDKPIMSMFPEHYIKALIKSIPNMIGANNVTVYIDEDYPLIVSLEHEDGVKFRVGVAPRISCR